MKGKIIAGVAAVVVIGGAIIFGVIQSKNKENLGQETSSVQEIKKENKIYPHYDSEKKATGYIDIKGNYVIEPQFSIAHMFDKDMSFSIVNASSRYESGNKVGVIDKDGNYIIEPKYSGISLQGNKYFILDEFIGNRHYYGLADISGKMIIDIDTNNKDEIKNISEDGIMFVNKNDGNGYFNLQGEKVISVYRGERFENGYAIAQKESDGPWGIINEKGEWVVEPLAEEMSSPNKNGYAGYSNENDEWGIVNINGNKSDAIFYGRIRFADNGLAFAQKEKNGKYGVINEKGEWVVEPKFDNGMGFNKNGISLVKVDGKYGTINEKGEFITEPTFDDYSGSADDEEGYEVKVDGKYGIIGNDGKILIEPF